MLYCFIIVIIIIVIIIIIIIMESLKRVDARFNYNHQKIEIIIN